MSFELAERFMGRIPGCWQHFPKCPCCDKTTLFLMPNELESAQVKNDHLVIKDNDFYGGKIALCSRTCGNDGFRPLDCKSFPFFPFFDSEGNLRVKKSNTCPLKDDELKNHEEQVLEVWQEMAKDQRVAEWLRRVQLDHDLMQG